MHTQLKEKEVNLAKKMLADKKEVVKWIRTEESYESLTDKGITLGRRGK